ncbi:MAG: hypothetical protein QG567_2518 [Campylobacterota bacterium]|nr:hypothetical protein [Campylobacterota bacterium]
MNVVSSNIFNTSDYFGFSSNTNGFKNSGNVSTDVAELSIADSVNGVRNPYSTDKVSDEAWNTFIKATKSYPQIAVDSTQKLLFENSEFSNSNTSAISLLDWANRADVIKENIALPQSTSVDISESKKRVIADQMKMLISSQNQILDNFSYFAKNGGSVSLNLVA